MGRERHCPGGDAVTKHTAQMMVCHEHIDAKAATSVHPETYAFCDLPAHSWCLDCQYYVCEIHVPARHERHQLQSVADERHAKLDAEAASQERRSGNERRA